MKPVVATVAFGLAAASPTGTTRLEVRHQPRPSSHVGVKIQRRSVLPAFEAAMASLPRPTELGATRSDPHHLQSLQGLTELRARKHNVLHVHRLVRRAEDGVPAAAEAAATHSSHLMDKATHVDASVNSPLSLHSEGSRPSPDPLASQDDTAKDDYGPSYHTEGTYNMKRLEFDMYRNQAQKLRVLDSMKRKQKVYRALDEMQADSKRTGNLPQDKIWASSSDSLNKYWLGIERDAKSVKETGAEFFDLYNIKHIQLPPVHSTDAKPLPTKVVDYESFDQQDAQRDDDNISDDDIIALYDELKSRFDKANVDWLEHSKKMDNLGTVTLGRSDSETRKEFDEYTDSVKSVDVFLADTAYELRVLIAAYEDAYKKIYQKAKGNANQDPEATTTPQPDPHDPSRTTVIASQIRAKQAEINALTASKIETTDYIAAARHFHTQTIYQEEEQKLSIRYKDPVYSKDLRKITSLNEYGIMIRRELNEAEASHKQRAIDEAKEKLDAMNSELASLTKEEEEEEEEEESNPEKAPENEKASGEEKEKKEKKEKKKMDPKKRRRIKRIISVTLFLMAIMLALIPLFLITSRETTGPSNHGQKP